MISSIPASLLKRVAEAADGHRTGKDIWIVAENAFPHESNVFTSQTDAETYKNGSPSSLSVFGPYNTPTDTTLSSAGKVISLTLEISDGNETLTKKINIDEVDALFWSVAAIDKFAIPYYTSLYGVTEAARIRSEIIKANPVILGHTDNTRWLPSPHI